MGAPTNIRSIPRGVALVRIQSGERRVVLVAPCLTHDQEIAARVFACTLAQCGLPIVVVLVTDVLALLSDLAA